MFQGPDVQLKYIDQTQIIEYKNKIHRDYRGNGK